MIRPWGGCGSHGNTIVESNERYAGARRRVSIVITAPATSNTIPAPMIQYPMGRLGIGGTGGPI